MTLEVQKRNIECFLYPAERLWEMWTLYTLNVAYSRTSMSQKVSDSESGWVINPWFRYAVLYQISKAEVKGPWKEPII